MPEKLRKNVCDDTVFSVIYKEYSNDLFKYLYYKFGENLGPNDKMQDAFMKLLDKCKEVTPDKAKGFLFTVANNMMLNEIKHQNVILRYKQIKPKAYTNESPEFILEQEQFLKKYQKALSLLTEDQRVAFLLNKVEGKKQAEIAEMLGTTRKAIENRIHVAYNKLKNTLDGFK
ncbi:RNA polymerase sigma-70 factor (ECF subfamily) [Aquimarina sp. EL_43]|uniref:RNA polymerase sigma factor n=1 Tax=unclassified Aquimarina TaxID=2627091 RepID=UPI0018CB43E4|nr:MULTISPECIES: sigma-70 family RNA polymerase sigma factor [unclassified Aquimarina]MBG6132402.1 RNA polymerase sigma-70 factor (ECF subfamily) [Aquimarina sp. EL_35]MBG6152533.1 RNA polymerase sigma-70 factor (ECF subfamily) [Aquimarina sp. EL_32]MBG6170540.1 RNA polymerase sigma-70 factor (ECF subfamily) [Aquimarina sp. EL_43]